MEGRERLVGMPGYPKTSSSGLQPTYSGLPRTPTKGEGGDGEGRGA